jgi:HPt (histidine-containing phosphotransfer) domain-containing protein
VSPPVPRPTAAPAAAADPVLVDADMQALLPEYLRSRHRLIATLTATLETGQPDELRRVAHQLAGSFALYGFAWAGDQCRWVERNFGTIEAPQLAQIAAQLRAHLADADIRFVSTDAEPHPVEPR